MCKIFQGYLFRKAFLAKTIIFMDVYLPEGEDGDVVGTDKDVYVVGDFTDEPWEIKVKCTYSEFFKAYKATIPVIDGSLFKFEVNGELITSGEHSTKFDSESQTYNNVVTIFQYIFDSETKKHKKIPLMNSLSLSNPSIRDTVLGKAFTYMNLLAAQNSVEPIFDLSPIDTQLKVKPYEKKDDEFFGLQMNEKIVTSPMLMTKGIYDILNEASSDSSEDAIEMTTTKGLNSRVKSECFKDSMLDFDDNESCTSSSSEDSEVEDTKIFTGGFICGKENEE